jgi:hypothetical protein
MGQWFQRLRANAKYGAVNDATIQGYLRAASQLENVWQQVDDKVDELILQGLPPWEAYSRMGYALAFVRACRMNVVFVQELLKAETASDAAHAGYLPKVTYDQALALSEHIEPTIEEALKAATNSRSILAPSTLPLKLGPHIGNTYQSLPLSHLQGTSRAAQEMKDWTAGLLAKYELALQAAKLPLPQEVSTHLEQMKNRLELGDFHLRTGVDMVGQMSQGEVAEALLQKAEGFLWEAMESFYTVSQLVAMPDLRPHPAQRNVPDQRVAQARPRVSTERPKQIQPVQKLPNPPEPVALDLLNQVIAEPGPAPKAPAQTSPAMLNMLNQVTSSPQASRQKEEPLPPTETAGLLDQAAPQAGADVPDNSRPDLSGLFAPAQGTAPGSQAQPAARPRKAPETRPTDTTLDLLSEICGEQE